jgi:predicted RNase H-like nuclease (RuvC/YqgF family)
VDAAAVGLAAAGIAAVPGVIATLNVRADRAAKATAENRATSLSEIRAINESLREDNERLREEMAECRRELSSLRVEMEQMRKGPSGNAAHARPRAANARPENASGRRPMTVADRIHQMLRNTLLWLCMFILVVGIAVTALTRGSRLGS